MTVDVEYARRGNISIAYQAIGDGPVDIIFGAGLVSHLDLLWADPYARRHQGIAAHIGSRIMALAEPAEVLVSATVRDLVFGSGVEFEPRGEHELKGLPGRWSVHHVVADRREDQRPAHQATPEQAALTPSPMATMTVADRALVEVANRAPRLSRFTLRMLSRRPASTRG